MVRWMSGFMQLITGIYLIIGLTWFNVFGNAAPLYMAALAFTAFGAHWFAVAHRRYTGGDAPPVPLHWRTKLQNKIIQEQSLSCKTN